MARFPMGGGKTRTSAASGTHPRWRDGKELFYVSPDNKIIAVDILSTFGAVRVGDVQPLFEIHAPVQPGYVYEVTPDGKKFLVITDAGSAPALTLATNWRARK